MEQHRFTLAIQRIDAANAADPHGKELLYGQRMTQCLDRFVPDASEALKLAARCQHIMRWMIPRNQFPKNRAGYHRWRTALYDFHADTAAEILREVGYDEATINRVRSLVRKERLKADPEAQTLEDIACLVFLEHYFADFAKEHDEPKLLNILKRTWLKMSPRGQEAAKGLDLAPRERTLIAKALANSPR